MEPVSNPASTLLLIIGASVVLLVLHILLQGMTATKELGSAWNAGPRDENKRPAGNLAGRAERASANYRETYPGFIALALGLIYVGEAAGLGLVGALVWFVCRIIYIPLYLVGIPYVRSLVWLGSLAGLGMMLLTLVF